MVSKSTPNTRKTVPLINNSLNSFEITIYFSYFLKYDGNDLKIDHRPVFQTSSCNVKLRQKSLENYIIVTTKSKFKAA